MPVILILLLMPTASASSWCINSTTRAHIETYTVSDETNETAYTESNLNDYCHYGCAGGRCIQGSETDSFTLVVLFVFVSFGFLYLGLNINSEQLAPLSYIFIPLGITFMVVALFFLGNQSVFGAGMNEALAGVMYGLIVVLIVVIAVFYIVITFSVLGDLPYGKKKYDKARKRGS